MFEAESGIVRNPDVQDKIACQTQGCKNNMFGAEAGFSLTATLQTRKHHPRFSSALFNPHKGGRRKHKKVNTAPHCIHADYSLETLSAHLRQQRQALLS